MLRKTFTAAAAAGALMTCASAHAAWQATVGHAGLPFSAIGVSPQMFVPGASLLVDLWGHVPGQPPGP